MQLNNVFSDWLKTNKISEDIQKDFDISFGENIIIPVHDNDGFFLFNKYRRSPLVETGPKYWYDKGGKITLYAWHKAKTEKNILITEGEKDTLVAWSHNIPATTSTGGAMSFQADWADMFKDKEVIICFDNDKAGAEGMVRTLKIIPHAKILLLPDIPNVKDISDYVMVGGDLHELLKTATHFNSIDEVASDRLQRIALFKTTYFHDAYIKENTKVIHTRRPFDGDLVSKARSFPIPELLDLRQNKCCCPFHNEKTPSFHYYEKTNTCYCFGGCGRAYDAIDIYRKLNNCTFIEAIKKLQ